jgi:hypothetical protein
MVPIFVTGFGPLFLCVDMLISRQHRSATILLEFADLQLGQLILYQPDFLHNLRHH